MKSKKITKAGGLTIPSDLRRALNLIPGDAVDIEQEGRTLIITPHIERCFICQSECNVVSYKGKSFCSECIKGLGGLIDA